MAPLKLSSLSLLMVRARVEEAILFCDDSVEVVLADGARLLMAGCGTAFCICRQRLSSLLSAASQQEWHLTAYAAGVGMREVVRVMLLFRNMFSERPFVCKILEEEEEEEGKENAPFPQNIEQFVKWPETLNPPPPPPPPPACSVDQEVRSLDGKACLFFPPHRQTGLVQFKVDGVWVTQLLTTAAPPTCWQHLVDLLRGSDVEGCCRSSTLPHPLPPSCPNPHRHKLRSAAEVQSKLMRVQFSEGVFYRLSWRSGHPLLEVLLGDSLYLCSEDEEGRFFISWSISPLGQVQQLSLCSNLPPPDAGCLSFAAAGISLGRVLGRARRMMAAVHCISAPLPCPIPCWQDMPPTHPNPQQMCGSPLPATPTLPSLAPPPSLEQMQQVADAHLQRLQFFTSPSHVENALEKTHHLISSISSLLDSNNQHS